MIKHDPMFCNLFVVPQIVNLGYLSKKKVNLGFVFYQVVEIVDQYETVCIPPANRTDKVKYIQTSTENTCNRNITVSFPRNKLSFMLLLLVKEINTLGSFLVIL